MSRNELPSNWSIVQLGHASAPSRPRALPNESQDLPYVGMEHVEAHSMRLLGTVPAVTMKSLGVRFHRGDILYGRLRPYLNKVWLANIEGVCSSEFIVLPPSAAFDSRYLSYFLNSAGFVFFAAHLNEGDRPRVNFDQIAQFPIPAPPRQEQVGIADEIEKQLTRLDAGITALKRVQAQLKRYRSAVLKAACEGRLVPTEAEVARREKRDYEPADRLLARTLKERRTSWEAEQLAKMKAAGKLPKDDKWKAKYVEPIAPDTTALPHLPSGWIWSTIDQLCSLVTKGSSPNWQGFDYCASGVLFIRSQNVGWGLLQLEERVFLPAAFNQKESRSVLAEGDVLLNIVGASIGRAALATTELAGANINQAVALIRPVTSLLGAYILRYILSPLAQQHIHREKVDVARANLSLADISEMPVPLPPSSEQQRIILEVERRLSVGSATEFALTSNETRATRLRQAILKAAFDGSLVPRDSHGRTAAISNDSNSISAQEKPLSKQSRSKSATVVPNMKATR
ncbi:restriction endonuclease subunit S [Corallococcus interemptor]|uniref:restriction endonuclease subunit S n=1 Tax=Corallococcus interemptor TaxID=2316720 RepID=UPI003D026316